MVGRRCCFILICVLVLVHLLAMPVFAASDDSGTGWDIVASIGNFFGDLITTIVDMAKAIGDFIFSGIEFLLDGLQKLFIPSDGYFDRLIDRIYTAFEKKFGNVLALANYLKNQFSGLRVYKGNLFVLKFPKDHLFGGREINLLSGGEDIANLIRGALSGFVMLSTVAFCYKRVVAMINT